MAGSTWGTMLTMTTWGESHGRGLGVTVDGCPAGLLLCEEDIQRYLDRRKPGQSRFTTARQEGDQVEILSGVFEGRTTGTPISMIVRNTDQRSHDYSAIMDVYRPGHADYPFDEKYGFRDYRGGGRSSGRETVGRVAAGAVAAKLLAELGVTVTAYTKSIGPVTVSGDKFDPEQASVNRLCMPDAEAAARAERYLDGLMAGGDSAGGIVECIMRGIPAGVGEPVFEKLDARLTHAVMSIGAVKGVEIGDGFAAAGSTGSRNNDSFRNGRTTEAAECDAAGASDNDAVSDSCGSSEARKAVYKATNHSGGILGGISDGDVVILRAAFKPTPSIARAQQTVNRSGENVEITIKGRHDPVIVPRAVVVVEAMCAFTVADMMLLNMSARLDNVKRVYGR